MRVRDLADRVPGTRPVTAALDRLDRLAPSGLTERVHAGQDYLVARVLRPHAVALLYLAYAFVFFYFGFQKPAPVYSPVRLQMGAFLPHFGVPLAAGMLFIGLYEMFLGLLLLFRQLRVAFWLFYPHQAVTFLTLLVIPEVAFQPPWIELGPLAVPVSLTGYGEFVVKNVVFVAGFTLLSCIELGDLAVDGRDRSAGETNR